MQESAHQIDRPQPPARSKKEPLEALDTTPPPASMLPPEGVPAPASGGAAVLGPGVEQVDYTNSEHRWRGVITRFNIAGRRKFFRLFMEVMAPTETTSILDVGVTPDQSAADSNFFEKWYPWPERITATSIEDASHLEQAHPGLTFFQTSGDRLPFDDGQFDIAFSTAVIEHVGDRRRQRQFVAELLRVSRRYFVTTPNRWYPVELHTYVPFLHWLPQRHHQRALRCLGKTAWAETENLNLLDEKSLRALFPPGVDPTVASARLFGMRSNILAYGSSVPAGASPLAPATTERGSPAGPPVPRDGSRIRAS